MSCVENFIRALRANPDLTEKFISLLGSPDFESDAETNTSLKNLLATMKNLLATMKNLSDDNHTETKISHYIDYFGQATGNTEIITTISKPISPPAEVHVSSNNSLLYFGQIN